MGLLLNQTFVKFLQASVMKIVDQRQGEESRPETVFQARQMCRLLPLWTWTMDRSTRQPSLRPATSGGRELCFSSLPSLFIISQVGVSYTRRYIFLKI